MEKLKKMGKLYYDVLSQSVVIKNDSGEHKLIEFSLEYSVGLSEMERAELLDKIGHSLQRVLSGISEKEIQDACSDYVSKNEHTAISKRLAFQDGIRWMLDEITK